MTVNFKTNFIGIMSTTCVITTMSSRNVYTNTYNVRKSHIVQRVETVKIQKIIMNVFVELFK